MFWKIKLFGKIACFNQSYGSENIPAASRRVCSRYHLDIKELVNVKSFHLLITFSLLVSVIIRIVFN